MSGKNPLNSNQNQAYVDCSTKMVKESIPPLDYDVNINGDYIHALTGIYYILQLQYQDQAACKVEYRNSEDLTADVFLST